jgi:hypothetical protein
MPGAVGVPQTRYARSGDVHFAYQVFGGGPLDLVWIPSLAHHVELNWENPVVERFLTRLAKLGRLIVFDKRGTGMPDRLRMNLDVDVCGVLPSIRVPTLILHRKDDVVDESLRSARYDRGSSELRGIPGEWRLFAVEQEAA